MAISNDSRARIKKVFEPIALAMGRLGLTPDGLTLIGFGVTAIGAALLAGQQWLTGGVVIFLGGTFDMFDGTLARATGRVSRFGEFMDSVFDRWGEALVYLGIIIGAVAAGFDEAAIFAGAAMGAAFMVSYARAKSDGLGFSAGTRMAMVGVMPREVRLVVLCFGLIVAGAMGVPATGGNVLLGALGIITVGSTLTAIQRILHVRSQATSATTTPIN